jgi:hypothetical protein
MDLVCLRSTITKRILAELMKRLKIEMVKTGRREKKKK